MTDESLYEHLVDSVERVKEKILGSDYPSRGLSLVVTYEIMCDDIIKQYEKTQRDAQFWCNAAIMLGFYSLGLTILGMLGLIF